MEKSKYFIYKKNKKEEPYYLVKIGRASCRERV